MSVKKKILDFSPDDNYLNRYDKFDIPTKELTLIISEKNHGCYYAGRNIKAALKACINEERYIEEFDNATMYLVKEGKKVDFRLAKNENGNISTYLIREFKEDVTGKELKDLENKLLKGTATDKDIDNCSQPVGKYIQKAFGIKFDKEMER